MRSMNFHNVHRTRVKYRFEMKASCRGFRLGVCGSLGSLYNVEFCVVNLIKRYMIRLGLKTDRTCVLVSYQNMSYLKNVSDT